MGLVSGLSLPRRVSLPNEYPPDLQDADKKAAAITSRAPEEEAPEVTAELSRDTSPPPPPLAAMADEPGRLENELAVNQDADTLSLTRDSEQQVRVCALLAGKGEESEYGDIRV